tara:strand:+ start:147680 stop:147880 length:201 start_codon:yes stop_codon:yes gene_type:complete
MFTYGGQINTGKDLEIIGKHVPFYLLKLIEFDIVKGVLSLLADNNFPYLTLYSWGEGINEVCLSSI